MYKDWYLAMLVITFHAKYLGVEGIFMMLEDSIEIWTHNQIILDN